MGGVPRIHGVNERWRIEAPSPSAGEKRPRGDKAPSTPAATWRPVAVEPPKPTAAPRPARPESPPFPTVQGKLQPLALCPAYVLRPGGSLGVREPLRCTLKTLFLARKLKQAGVGAGGATAPAAGASTAEHSAVVRLLRREHSRLKRSRALVPGAPAPVIDLSRVPERELQAVPDSGALVGVNPSPPGGGLSLLEWRRAMPAWATIKAFEQEVGLVKCTVPSTDNLCLMNSYLVAAGHLPSNTKIDWCEPHL